MKSDYDYYRNFADWLKKRMSLKAMLVDAPILIGTKKRRPCQPRPETNFPYYFAWKNNSKRLTLYRRKLRIITRFKKNSMLVEFENGQCEIISGNAIRRNHA